MDPAIRVPIAGSAMLLFVLTGCTKNWPYRTYYGTSAVATTEAERQAAVIEITDDYKLGFVEFDDQGWFWDQRQWQEVQAMIQSEAKLDTPESCVPVVIVLFVHGWKNNAAYDNGNVALVRHALSGLSEAEKAESAQMNRVPRKIIGVFAGWRGLSATVEPFKELSFYERKNTAHKVGHAALTQLLVHLENLETASNTLLRKARAKSPIAEDTETELVIVGHSFGGAAVHSAVSQLLEQRFIESSERGRMFRPFGSLLILINPAFEASRYYDLNELVTSVSKYPRGQRPVMAIFTSKADWATKYAFKVGRFFSTFFEWTRRDKPQREANLAAVGHFEPFITHDLIYDPTARLELSAAGTEPTTKLPVKKSQAMIQRSVTNVERLRRQWRANAEEESRLQAPTEFAFDGCRLRARKDYKSGDPFLVVSVDKKIIADHDDIAEPIFIDFLRDFIQFSRKEADSSNGPAR